MKSKDLTESLFQGCGAVVILLSVMAYQIAINVAVAHYIYSNFGTWAAVAFIALAVFAFCVKAMVEFFKK